MDNHPRYRSLFWPILLVGIGIVWLLSNLGIIQHVNLGSILRLWPLLLVILGLDILFSRQYPWVGAVVSLLAVVGIVAFLIASPSLGVGSGPTTKTETFTTPIGDANSVEYDFDTASAPVFVSALDESGEELIVADITHRGTMRFDAAGTTSKTISLSESSDNNDWFYWDFSFDSLKWDIALSPVVPTDLYLNGGSGSIEMDLSGLNLTSLRTDFGSGSSDVILPENTTPYQADIESGSGSVNIELPSDTSLILTLDAGSGSIDISVPSDTALRVEVMDDGSGSLDIPDQLVKSSDSDGFSIGAWQSDNYVKAKNQTLIQIIGQGSGSISIR